MRHSQEKIEGLEHCLRPRARLSAARRIYRDLKVLMVVVLGASAFTGCLPTEEERALRQLQTEGIPTTITSLFDALSSANHEQLELLLKVSVRLDGVDEQGRTPLISAIYFDNADAVTTILPLTTVEQLAVEDKKGMTALSYAIDKKQYPLVEELIERGAPASTQVAGGKKAIAAAVDSGDIEMAGLLIGDAEEPNLLPDELQEPLYVATESGNHAIVELLLDAGADPNYFSIVDDRSPLAASVESNNTQMAKLLAENGAAMLCVLPAASVATGKSSGGKILEPHLLNVAFDNDNKELIQLLVELKAPLNHPGKDGVTPLVRALQNKDIGLAKLLLAHGADPGNTLFIAIEEKNQALVDLLLAHGACLQSKNEAGDTALHIAVESGDAELVQQLLESEPDLSATGRHGQTAFAVAAAMQNLPIMEQLLKYGVDPNSVFAHKDLKDSFKQMIPSNKFLFYLKRDAGLTPIMLAASYGNVEMIKLLMKHGAKRFKTSKKYSRWPINFACDGEHIKCAQLLLGRSSDSTRAVHVVISLSSQKATIYKNGEPFMSSNVSTGMRGYRTPTGKFVITNKARHHTSSIYGSPMPYFQRLSCQAFGFHVGHCPGYPASHGCIRMPHSKAKAFFSITKVGDPVEIVP